jgi:cytochrome c-type biogenesis protein CcmH/NrfG
MTAGNAFFFIAGALAILAALFIAYPWLAGRPRTDLFGVLPRWVPLVVIVGIAGVLALYLKLGSPQLTDQDASPAADAAPVRVAGGAAGAGGGAAQKQAAASMDSAVSGLERRLAAGGGSDGDWELLAKSYEFLGRPEDAAAARQKRLPAGAGSGAAPAVSAPTAAAPAPKMSAAAVKLLADANAARKQRDFAAARAIYVKLAARNEMTADAWADYADVSASLNGNSLSGPPAVLIGNALRLDPQHPKALWLQASMEHETGHYAEAVRSWQKLAAVLGPASGDAKLIAANLAEDQRLAGGNGSAAAATVQAPQGIAVRGEVVLADALRGKVPAGLTLFIVAKSVHSPGPPVAILRTTTGSWPLQFQLDDSQAMLPERKLSTAGAVTVEARTSKTGQAMPAPGDFQGVTAQFDPAAGKPIRVVIQRVIG